MHIHSKRAGHAAKKMTGIDKNYGLTINYHPRKANVVVDALSLKSEISLTVL